MKEFNGKFDKIRLRSVGEDVYCINVPWFENFNDIKGEKCLINNIEYEVLAVDRNRCSSFFVGTNEQWEKRDVWLKVKDNKE